MGITVDTGRPIGEGLPHAACAEAVFRIFYWVSKKPVGFRDTYQRWMLVSRVRRHLAYFSGYLNCRKTSDRAADDEAVWIDIAGMLKIANRHDAATRDGSCRADYQSLCSYRASAKRIAKPISAPYLPPVFMNTYNRLAAIPVDDRWVYAVGDKSFVVDDPRVDLVRSERLFGVLRTLLIGRLCTGWSVCVDENLGVGDVIYALPLIRDEPRFRSCRRPDVAWLMGDKQPMATQTRYLSTNRIAEATAHYGRVAATVARRVARSYDLMTGSGDSFITAEDLVKLLVLQRYGSWENGAKALADALVGEHLTRSRTAEHEPRAGVFLDISGKAGKRGCIQDGAAIVDSACVLASRIGSAEPLIVNVRPSHRTGDSVSDVATDIHRRGFRNVRVIAELDARSIALEMRRCSRVVCSAATSGLISLFFGFPTAILLHPLSNPKWEPIRLAFEARRQHQCSFHDIGGEGDQSAVFQSLRGLAAQMFGDATANDGAAAYA